MAPAPRKVPHRNQHTRAPSFLVSDVAGFTDHPTRVLKAARRIAALSAPDVLEVVKVLDFIDRSPLARTRHRALSRGVLDRLPNSTSQPSGSGMLHSYVATITNELRRNDVIPVSDGAPAPRGRVDWSQNSRVNGALIDFVAAQAVRASADERQLLTLPVTLALSPDTWYRRTRLLPKELTGPLGVHGTITALVELGDTPPTWWFLDPHWKNLFFKSVENLGVKGSIEMVTALAR